MGNVKLGVSRNLWVAVHKFASNQRAILFFHIFVRLKLTEPECEFMEVQCFDLRG